MAAHRAGRTARRVDEYGIGAPRPQRRRLKIGGDGANRHSRAPRRAGETAHAVVPGVTREHSRAAGFERDGLAARRGAGIVDELARPNGCVSRHQSMRGILDNEGAFGVAGKVFGCRVPASGYRVKTDSRAEWGRACFDAGFAKSPQESCLIPAGCLKNQFGLCVIPCNQSISILASKS